MGGHEMKSAKQLFSPPHEYMQWQWRFILEGLHTHGPFVGIFLNTTRLLCPVLRGAVICTNKEFHQR